MQAIRSQVQVTKKKSLLRIGARMFGAFCDAALDDFHVGNESKKTELIEGPRLHYKFDGRDDYLHIGELERQAAEAWTNLK
ncbi:hypothetical protein [Corticibacter populi]|uniref:hypothetical protein n=1 Tax=Corticibacter populi TaxID=1550736 RepID=UPI00102CC104|nr:hypothetical protein [Corticibacter populi]